MGCARGDRRGITLGDREYVHRSDILVTLVVITEGPFWSAVLLTEDEATALS